MNDDRQCPQCGMAWVPTPGQINGHAPGSKSCLRYQITGLREVVAKLYPGDGYIRRDQVLEYWESLRRLEDADARLGSVASIVVRNTINAFYDARDAAAAHAAIADQRERRGP